MSSAATSRWGFDLPAIASANGFGRIRASWQGLVSGYKAYQIYSAFDAKSDAELNVLGLDRTELPRVAMKTIAESEIV